MRANKPDKYGTIEKRIAKNKALFLSAYKVKDCNISDTCAAIKINRSTYYEWRKNDKEFDKRCSEIEESLIDIAESCLLENIKAGKEASLFFFLVNRSKGRWQNIQKIENKFDDITTQKINEVFDTIAKAIKG